jgi:hypothetical protein
VRRTSSEKDGRTYQQQRADTFRQFLGHAGLHARKIVPIRAVYPQHHGIAIPVLVVLFDVILSAAKSLP